MVNVNVRIVKQFSEEVNRVQVFAIVNCDDEEYLNKAMHYNNRSSITGKQYLHKFLQKLFKDHEEFYKAIGFEYDMSIHHGDDRDFHSDCTGFEEFMREYYGTPRWQEVSEQHLQKLANLCLQKIQQIVKKYEEARNTNVSVSVTASFTSVSSTKQETSLDKIDFKTNDTILLTGNKAYKVTIAEIKDIQGLNDIVNSVANSVHGAYELQLKSKIAVMEDRVKQLEQELNHAKQRYLQEGIKLALSELQGWRIDGNYAVYSKTIYVSRIRRNGRLYSLPESLARRFYVKGLKVAIATEIAEAHCDKAYHCNCNDGKVCIGSLSGQDFITVLKKLPETLRTMNLDSAYSNDAKDEAEEIFAELAESEEEVVTWTT